MPLYEAMKEAMDETDEKSKKEKNRCFIEFLKKLWTHMESIYANNANIFIIVKKAQQGYLLQEQNIIFFDSKEDACAELEKIQTSEKNVKLIKGCTFSDNLDLANGTYTFVIDDPNFLGTPMTWTTSFMIKEISKENCLATILSFLQKE